MSNIKNNVQRAIFVLSLAVITSCTTLVEVSDHHYRIYRSDGRVASLAELLIEVKNTDVTFMGEGHNDPVAHYLEETVLRGVWESEFALSFEMFETDVQYVLNEYMLDLIREDHLIKSARAWQNYEIDYKPLIEFAKDNNVSVIAANAPRRYVNMVSRTGQESLLGLSDQGKKFLPPLPYPEASEAYSEKFKGLMSRGGGGPESSISETMSEEEAAKAVARIERTLQAQSLWDSSMAWSIASYLSEHPESHILHINGSFHSAERMGVVDQLEFYRAEATSLVITMISSESFPEFDAMEMLNQGDFIIVTDGSLPRTY